MPKIIKNKSLLAKTRQRKIALEIVEAGLAAIQTEAVLSQKVKLVGNQLRINGRQFNLNDYQKIGFLGIGKCAFKSARFFEKLLKAKLCGGVVIDISGGRLKKIKSFIGSHPLPSAKNIVATKAAIRFVKSLDPEKDLLIMVISGGGSSLFFSPVGISLKDFQSLTLDLQKSKADIYKLNTVRKHLSLVKGGKLAKIIYPLKTIGLVFSDVIGDDLSFIASGPLVLDKTTNEQAKKVLQQYGLWQRYKGKIAEFSETPKDKKYFKNIQNFLILNNQTALQAMANKAKQLGLKPKILTDKLSCLNFNAFQAIRTRAKKFKNHNLFLAGGETKVNIIGKGKGGRNLEAALAGLVQIKPNELFLAFASDGIDNTDFAGGVSDTLALLEAKKLGLKIKEYLKDNDSYNFFKQIGDYLKTGPTGSNVSDLMLYYKTNRE
ncbi:MAG: DUF4147 domain-containing protein [Patescibacteria group bacterium]